MEKSQLSFISMEEVTHRMLFFGECSVSSCYLLCFNIICLYFHYSVDDGIEDEFLCPITREVMREPVIAAGTVNKILEFCNYIHYFKRKGNCS